MLIAFLTSLLIAATPHLVPADESNPRLKLIERNVFDATLEPDLRKISVNDLTDIGSEAALSILIRAIQSADESVALSTLEAIAEMNNPPRMSSNQSWSDGCGTGTLRWVPHSCPH